MKHNPKELKVWQKAMNLTVDIYKATSDFPKNEVYGITSQIRRCAVSVPSNIAEGAGRNTDAEFNHFLGIANGSSFELMTQIELAQRLQLLDSQTSEKLLSEIDEIQRMTRSLSSIVSSKSDKKSKV
jgi:four helix bundle protein